jgi:hypothetical protein
MIDYRILGPLEVSADGRAIEVGGPRLRELLVAMLVPANEPVPRDVLLHELGASSPRRAPSIPLMCTSRGCASRSTWPLLRRSW